MPEKTIETKHFETLFLNFAPLQIPQLVTYSTWITHVPFAFWLVETLKPKLLVELGTYAGVSFCAFCQQVARSNLNTMCYAVDTWQGDSQARYDGEEVYPKIARFTHEHYSAFAHLIRSTFDGALPLFRDGSIDLLHIDGFHSYDSIMHDFESWLPKMSTQGVILMHDINARMEGYGGLQAWDNISSRFPTFAFEHGFGLGVVLIGSETQESLSFLVECGKNKFSADKIRRYFMQLGALQQAIQELTLNGHDVRCALDAARNTAAEHQRDFEQRLEESEKRAASLLRHYSDSRSWRLTKPLRLAANWWRCLRGLPPTLEPQLQCSPVDNTAPSRTTKD